MPLVTSNFDYRKHFTEIESRIVMHFTNFGAVKDLLIVYY